MRDVICLVLMFAWCDAATAQEEVPSKSRAMWLSAAVPGLGELYLNNWKYDGWGDGRFHFLSEVAVWSGHYLLANYSSWTRDDSRVFAAAHGGVDIRTPKPNRYYVNIGKFSDLYAYNELQRRATGIQFLYEEIPTNRWTWDSEASRKKYDRMRIRSDQTKRLAQYLLFGLAVNRVLSLVSTARPHRSRFTSADVQVLPEARGGIVLSWTMRFYSQSLHP